jgi:hypothetical protein
VFTVTVATPELQLMLVMEFTVWRPKSTMESDPAPPGVAKAQFNFDETAIRGFGPLLMFTTFMSMGEGGAAGSAIAPAAA